MVDLNTGVPARPRFRQDLVAEPIEDGGARFIDVADPDRGQVFRFYEVEYSLACAMDGERDVAGIVRWAQDELGLQTTPNEVKTVIATLGDLGYLDSDSAAARAAETAAAQVAARPAPSHAPVAASRPVPEHREPARPASDDLAPGVVVGRTAASAASGDDLELGDAGAKPAAASELPRAPELELGAPGSSAPPAEVATHPSIDLPLGAAGRVAEPPRSEVSIDLSQHLAVGPDDVKEAVRASQVMRAVDVPKELLEADEPTVAAPPPEPEPARPAPRAAEPEKRPEPVAARPEPRAPEPEKRREPEKRPEPVAARPEPRAPEPEKRPAAPPTAPARTVSPALIFLAVVVVLGAGAFAVYKYVIEKSEQTEQTNAVPKAVVPPPRPAPAPPPPETHALATEQPAAEELKSATAGQLESLVANNTQVKAGDTVAKLAGYKPIETEVTSIQRDIDKRVAPELAKAEKDRDDAQAAGNKAAVTAAEARITDRKKSLADKQAKLAARQAELDKYLVKASVAGTVALVAKPNAHVTPTDVLAKVTPAPVLVATFKKAGDAVKGAHVTLTGAKSSDTKLSCVVVQVDDAGTKIACPQDAAAPGTEVAFGGVEAPPAGEAPAEIEMGDEPAGSGSAAPSAPSAGSGSPAAGSAAAKP